MRCLTLWLMVSLLAGPVLLIATATSAAQEIVTIDIVQAFDRGCSDDHGTTGAPDLRVSVTVNGEVVLRTAKAQGYTAPLLAVSAQAPVAVGDRIGIQIEEAEPSGFLGTSTRWVKCDSAPGSQRIFEKPWDGTTTEFVARGDDADAAEAIVVVGRDAPAIPIIQVQATARSADITWDAGGQRQGLGWDDFEQPFHDATSSAGDYQMENLCDGTTYLIRVVRWETPWVVAGRAAIDTQNLPPGQPQVLAADRSDGGLTVSWWTPTVHDIQRFEIHAGPAGFSPGPGSLRQEISKLAGHHEETRDVATQAGDAEVRIVSVDNGGLTATSPAFAMGSPRRESPGDMDSCVSTGPYFTAGTRPGDGGGSVGRGMPGPGVVAVVALLGLAGLARRR